MENNCNTVQVYELQLIQGINIILKKNFSNKNKKIMFRML